MKLNKLDYINVASIAAAVTGLILALVGCLVLSVPKDIGMNFNFSPVAVAGIVLVTLGFVGGILGNVLYVRRGGMNRFLTSLCLYVTVLSFLAVVVLIPYTIFIPVINPSNG